jgi:hypothetical protein
VPLLESGAFDLAAVDAAIAANTAVKVLHVQRSCGYQWRRSIPIAEIERYAVCCAADSCLHSKLLLSWLGVFNAEFGMSVALQLLTIHAEFCMGVL